MNRTRRAALAVILVTATTASITGVASAAPSGVLSAEPGRTGYSAITGQSGQGSGSGQALGSRNGQGRGQGWAGSGTRKGAGVRLGGSTADHSDLPAPVPGATITRTVKNELRYLVEEEKLAGDIYALAKSLYGDRVFANIARAEDSHADQVRLLLERYEVADPTKGRATGTFQDRALQKLYDRLATQVRKSRADAVKAGVLIEKTDIADLKVLLARDLPADVEQVAENLLAGSERHLAAFRRQA